MAVPAAPWLQAVQPLEPLLFCRHTHGDALATAKDRRGQAAGAVSHKDQEGIAWRLLKGFQKAVGRLGGHDVGWLDDGGFAPAFIACQRQFPGECPHLLNTDRFAVLGLSSQCKSACTGRSHGNCGTSVSLSPSLCAHHPGGRGALAYPARARYQDRVGQAALPGPFEPLRRDL